MIADVYFLSRHVSGLELGWTLIGIAGLVASLTNVSSALRDLAALAATHRLDGRDVADLAMGSLRAEAIRLVEQALVVTIGIVAMTLPTPDPAPPTTSFGWLIIVALYGIAGGLALNSVLDHRLRERLRDRPPEQEDPLP